MLDPAEGRTTARWLYWCPRTHLQWNPSVGSDGGGMSTSGGNPGTLQVLQMPNHCITPGPTLGFAVEHALHQEHELQAAVRHVDRHASEAHHFFSKYLRRW